MALYGMSDNGVEIPAEVDGALFNFLSGNTDYVIGGIGDEFGVTYSSGSLTVTLGTGIGVLCGRTVQETDATTTLELPANSSGHIVIEFNKSLAEGSQVSLKVTSEVTREDINNTGTVADLELYEYVTNGNGVTSFIDKRNIQTQAGGGGGDSLSQRQLEGFGFSNVPEGRWKIVSTGEYPGASANVIPWTCTLSATESRHHTNMTYTASHNPKATLNGISAVTGQGVFSHDIGRGAADTRTTVTGYNIFIPAFYGWDLTAVQNANITSATSWLQKV